jgi:F0F1-type ATP synthase assembly protein I
MNNHSGNTTQNKLSELIKSKSFLKFLAGTLIGGTSGFLNYHFIGCPTGTCQITSHPIPAVIAGAIMGYLVSELF